MKVCTLFTCSLLCEHLYSQEESIGRNCSRSHINSNLSVLHSYSDFRFVCKILFKMRLDLLLAVLLVLCLAKSSGYHVLFFHNLGTKSHLIQIYPLAEELLSRGHEVSGVFLAVRKSSMKITLNIFSQT